jgi:phage shock protein C
MTAFCNNCGASLPVSARFCSACGSVVAGFPGYAAGYGAGYAPFVGPRLMRPIFGRQFAGVCAGVSRTYGWDVGLVRVLTVIGAIFLCPVVEVAYLACWIGIPEEQLEMQPPPPQVPAQ